MSRPGNPGAGGGNTGLSPPPPGLLQKSEGGGGGSNDIHMVDTAEHVNISSLSLLKMLKHGRAGVPMEVMGLMLGDFLDPYTVNVVDVFAMPQVGGGVNVEAIDPAFQAKMLDMLRQTGRPEMVVGWYHSHPGFGCWLSSVDINTQQAFESLSHRAVAVVIDPIQSVKGKVIIDAFRRISPQSIIFNQDPRETTSNLGCTKKPEVRALVNGLNRHYYSLAINFPKTELEQMMLSKLHQKEWTDALDPGSFADRSKSNQVSMDSICQLAKAYNKALEDEEKFTKEQLAMKNVGKPDPKRHIEQANDKMLEANLVQGLAASMKIVAFKED